MAAKGEREGEREKAENVCFFQLVFNWMLCVCSFLIKPTSVYSLKFTDDNTPSHICCIGENWQVSNRYIASSCEFQLISSQIFGLNWALDC